MIPRTFLFVFLTVSALAGPGGHASGDSSLAVEELQFVVRALRAENETLRERNAVLSGELIRVRRLLEELQALPSAEGSPAPAPEPPPPGFEITYVNPTWHYLLLRAGSQAGLAEGRRGRVLRDGAEIGAVTLTRVKEEESVADIDPASLRGEGRYPRAGDRILFLSPLEDSADAD